nr:hypothetical protein [Tanacetum cinerariifolium]
MSILKFAETHNIIVFLAKPTKSEGFKQIVDFLNVNPIKYALTVNPTVYTLCIEKFWTTAKAKNINEEAQIHTKKFWTTAKAKNINEEAQIHTKVDGKKVIISKALIRRDLRFGDKGGIDCFSNEVIFEQLTLMGLERDTTTATSLDAEQDKGTSSGDGSGTKTPWRIPLLRL